ncbi:hypothetical protein [Spirosoma fluviale]|nr:hypothetical protein [Spirosoma fluviale]
MLPVDRNPPNEHILSEHPTPMRADGDVGAFTHLPGWAAKVGLGACCLSP